MLKIIVSGKELFDDETQEFIDTSDDVTLELEHSLVSLSKWELYYEIPFLGKDKQTTEQIIYYIKCMTLTPDVSDEVFSRLSSDNLDSINAYINAKMSATWFNEAPGPPNSALVITSELIYYWMIVFEIPFECQYWHLNKLFTLIRVCNIKQAKPEKMSRSDIAARNRILNAQRREQLGTKG